MIDPELKEHLEKIESELAQMHQKAHGIKHALLRGAVYGAGYILGVVLIILIIGWALNIVGVIPAFNRFVSESRTALQDAGRIAK